MFFEYEGFYGTDEPQMDLSSRGIEIASLDAAVCDLAIEAWKCGFDRGANAIKQEWDEAEELRAESAAGWDW